MGAGARHLLRPVGKRTRTVRRVDNAEVEPQDAWQHRDLVALRNLYGLSSDFVNDFVSYESVEREKELV